jgi:hypothetical protein
MNRYANPISADSLQDVNNPTPTASVPPYVRPERIAVVDEQMQLNNVVETTANQASVIFEQAYQQVGWQYNAGRDIIINVQSRGELATALSEMQQQMVDGFNHQVINEAVARQMWQQLDTIIKQLQSTQPQVESILKDLRTTREYLQEESVRLAQHIPPQHDERGFFHLLVGMATLFAIAFDLGATAAVVTSLFGLSLHRSET